MYQVTAFGVIYVLSLFPSIPLRLSDTMAHTIDTDAVRELELYALNFSGYHYNTVGKTLSKFYKQGTFNIDRAIAYIERYLVVPAAKDYKLLCGSMSQSWNQMFPKPERLVAAESIAHDFVSEFRLGNFF
jgi:hypothetical protein